MASDCISKLATPQKDYIELGYVAGTDGPEVKCPDLELNQLIAIEDVTDTVKAAKTAGMSDADANVAMKGAADRSSKAACLEKVGASMRCDVVTLYAGGKYQLYTYNQYNDVRLVFAPEEAIGFFGGDPDNFTYPRYDLDLAIFRVYADDKPVAPKDYLTWSTTGPKDGDPVFVSGNPAKTDRMDPMAQLARLRDVAFPYFLDQSNLERAALHEFARGNAEAEREIHHAIFRLENGLKAIGGENRGLHDPVLMKRKADDEAALKKAVLADSKLAAAYGGRVGRRREGAEGLRRSLQALRRPGARREPLRAVLDRAGARPLPARARHAERDAPPRVPRLGARFAQIPGLLDGAAVRRGRGGRDQDVARNPAGARSRAAKDPARGPRCCWRGATARLATRARRRGGHEADGPQRAPRAVRRRRARAAVEASTDPLVALSPPSSTHETRAGRAQGLRGRGRGADAPGRAEDQAQVVFAVQGTGVYPDATYTLRLSPGVVKGYREERARDGPESTDFAGMYKHATGKEPLKLPGRWLAQKSSLKGDAPLDFVSTNDIIGGNSGSRMAVNAGGRAG